MINIAELKSVATPQSVARYYLGIPSKERGNELWYKSPFRQEERTASFEVSDKGFHDFGTNEHYDVISFVQRLRRCNFKEAVETLCKLYNIREEYSSDRLAKWLKEQRDANERYKLKVEQNFLNIWDALETEERENNECLKIFAGDFSDDTYKICLDRKCYIDGFIEYLANDTDTFKEKEDLLRQVKKGELPKWLMMKLKNNTICSMIMNITRRRKLEY